jgi:predicted dehydrogenase
MSVVDDPAPPDEPLRVGVVGAGPWAQFVHAPMFAHDARTELTGVWARRADAAQELAAANGTVAVEDLDALFDRCDAVAFAVPPDVQATLAAQAARAGKAVLLEKPIALDLDGARRLTDAIEAAGVGSQIVLTWRYADTVRTFLTEVAAVEPIGGRGYFISGAGLGGPFATPWRLDDGMLLDLGPHVIDALDAALGRVVGVRAHGDLGRWVGLLLEHESGLVSEASITNRSNVEPARSGVEVYTADAVLEVDAGAIFNGRTLKTIVGDFVATARGTAHPLDVHHGLRLQAILADAGADLDR